MKAIIFNIQRFCLHDGPGIRTVVFFKGCNFICPWCQNPESINPSPEIAFYNENCIRCLDCEKVCSQKAILTGVVRRIDFEKCNICGKCAEVCPTGAIQLIGKQYSTDELLTEVLKDKDYYDDSNGGITVSGGEPTMQSDFLFEFLSLCKTKTIHTCIETNGHFKFDKFRHLIPLLDLIYFDIKIIDNVLHQTYVKKSNKQLLHNAQDLIECKTPVEFRLPLIPGYSDTNQNLQQVLNFLTAYKIKSLHLLPYNNFGESKLPRINSKLSHLNLDNYSENQFEYFKDFFKKGNIYVNLGST
jgi:pyruvate formate lyase activating enzyme